MPPFRRWLAARRMIGQFVVVKSERQSCVGLLTRVGLANVSVVLTDGTLWSDSWRDIISIRQTSCPAYLRLVRAAGQVA